MTLPRRGSRLITVDGVGYRWLLRHKPSYSQGLGSALNYVVERADVQGAVLIVVTEFARPDNWLGKPSGTVRPADVAASIRDALSRGWQPDRPGPPFTLTPVR